MGSEKKSILVTGDIVKDYYLYQGDRSTPNSDSTLGTFVKTERGGAFLLYQLLDRLFSAKVENNSGSEEVENNTDIDVHFGLQDSIFKKLPESFKSYATLEPCSDKSGSDKVWRVVHPLGYGHQNTDSFQMSDYASKECASKPNIAVLDDAGLGFRFSTASECWEGLLNKKSNNLDWVVLKMASPLGQGDLWRHVKKHFQKKLVVVISIEDIRQEDVRISKGISWERTVQDLMYELNFNPAVTDLLKCKHLIVTFMSEGALWVENPAKKNAAYKLLFDTEHMEGEWRENQKETIYGNTSCFVSSIVHQLVRPKKDIDLEKALHAGLSAMRELYKNGHGPVASKNPAFPFDMIAETIRDQFDRYAVVSIPPMDEAKSELAHRWQIIEGVQNTADSLPLYGLARSVALFGPRVMANIPHAEFGKLFTVDRSEIESLRTIRQLIQEYELEKKAEKPLSIAVFGPPGAGKSFGIKQIAKAVLGDKVPILEFNLSQFVGPEALTGAFHQVRDKVLEGNTPIVFWDEFDSREYMWLQYLLAPMQDGAFQEGQITHPIGKCVFIFAGGTSYKMENFGPSEDDKEEYKKFKLLKGPDFASRLKGYLNVLGPNCRQKFESGEWVDDLTDICFPVRRALLMRVMLGFVGKKENKPLNIDRGLLTALLEIKKYKHGARSLETIISVFKGKTHPRVKRSDLPPEKVMSLHIEYDDFLQLMNRDHPFKLKADKEMAIAIHNHYRKLDKKKEWKYNMPFAKLPPGIQADNFAAAERIPNVLEFAGLYLSEGGEQDDKDTEKIDAIIKNNIELLAEAEHNGWKEYKEKNGWKHGEERNDDKRIHPLLVLYKELSDEDKKKDRNQVSAYPKIVKKADHRIVTHLEKTDKDK